MTRSSSTKTSPTSDDPQGGAARATDLPEVLHVEDIARVMRIGLSAARKAIARGEVGAHVRLGRRVAVLRSTFLAALQARQTAPQDPQRPPTIPDAPEWASALLRRRERLGRGP